MEAEFIKKKHLTPANSLIHLPTKGGHLPTKLEKKGEGGGQFDMCTIIYLWQPAWPIFSQQSFPTQVIINMEAEFMKKLGTSPPPTLTTQSSFPP